MRTSVMLCLSVEIPDGHRVNLTSEPTEDGGYLYMGHVYRLDGHSYATHFSLSDITADCQRAITDRIQSAIDKAI